MRSSKCSKSFLDPLLFCLNAMLCCCSVMSNSLWPLTVGCQAPWSMEFSRREYWSGLPCPPPGDLPNPATEPRSPALQVDSLPSEPPGKPAYKFFFYFYWRQTLTSPKKTLEESANETTNPRSLTHTHTRMHTLLRPVTQKKIFFQNIAAYWQCTWELWWRWTMRLTLFSCLLTHHPFCTPWINEEFNFCVSLFKKYIS